ncbi:MAG: hypothetical protein KatS3mg105_3097 [Gemmatales bacterium]|nr:MAG: hypothetical protein KatS3mg105_3097 [Gemmatales bacterium]
MSPLSHSQPEHANPDPTLNEIKARYEIILNAANEGIWILDADLKISFVNQRMCSMLGYAADELLGRSPMDFVHESDRPHIQELLERRRRGLAEQFDFRYRRKDGSTLWAIVSSNPLLNAEGKFHGALAMFTDITQRKLAEEKLWSANQTLQAVVQCSPLAINIIDCEGRVLMWNPASERIFGWTAQEVVGKRLPTIPDDKRDEFETMLSEVRQGKNYSAMEVMRLRRDGSLIDVNLWTTPLRDESGAIIGIMAIIADVTEHKRLRREFLHAQKMEAIGRLAGGVAHDFNNLLTVISGYSDLLLATLPADDPTVDLIRDMKKAEERAISLTRQLLSLSRKQIVEPRVVDLNAVVANMDKMLRRLIGEHIELITEWNPAVGRVKIDPAQLEQIILNLAVNARDAMPKGGKLTITTENTELDEEFTSRHPGLTPGEYVCLVFHDTGCGMDAETLAHIFEPFFTTKDAEKGTGLGLATIYAIVKQNRGHIQVASIPGQGSLFEIFLPRVDESPDVIPQRKVESLQAKFNEVILIVEDEDLLRDYIRKALKRRGFSVLEARNGYDAIRLLKEHTGPVHLVLSDVVMPRLSGPAMYRQLQRLRPELKVVYMSGYITESVSDLGLDGPDVQLLRKPFIMDDLLRKVREVLDGTASTTTKQRPAVAGE